MSHLNSHFKQSKMLGNSAIAIDTYKKIKQHMLISKERIHNSGYHRDHRVVTICPIGTLPNNNLQGNYLVKWNPKDKHNYTEMTYIQFCQAYGIEFE